MEVPRHWRLRKVRLGLIGNVRENDSGDPEFSLDGVHWNTRNGNSHNVSEKPLEQQVIYQAPRITADIIQ